MEVLPAAFDLGERAITVEKDNLNSHNVLISSK